MSQGIKTVHSDDAKAAASAWKGLYRTDGAAALICAVMYLIASGVHVPANLAGPPPETVLEWFTVFEESSITGLFFLGLADIVIVIFWGPMSLALYAALKPGNRAWSLVATTFVFVGIAVYLGTNTSFSMLSLSRQYAAATTESERSMVLAAGLVSHPGNRPRESPHPALDTWRGGFALCADY